MLNIIQYTSDTGMFTAFSDQQNKIVLFTHKRRTETEPKPWPKNCTVGYLYCCTPNGLVSHHFCIFSCWLIIPQHTCLITWYLPSCSSELGGNPNPNTWQHLIWNLRYFLIQEKLSMCFLSAENFTAQTWSDRGRWLCVCVWRAPVCWLTGDFCGLTHGSDPVLLFLMAVWAEVVCSGPSVLRLHARNKRSLQLPILILLFLWAHLQAQTRQREANCISSRE